MNSVSITMESKLKVNNLHLDLCILQQKVVEIYKTLDI